MDDKKTAYDLLREWIPNDAPVCRAALDVVRMNREYELDYGAGLRDLILDIRSAPLAYGNLCDPEMGDRMDNSAAVSHMRRITDREFGAVNWSVLADDIFPKEG
jgi:hypothetical protein